MGPGLNKVTLIGYLGADPERRRTQSGLMVANLRIATTESWFDRESQERKENTEWNRVVFFGKTAERMLEHLHKGSRIYIEGRLQTRKWQDQSGQDRYTTEVIGRDFIYLDRLEGRESRGVAESDPFESESPEPSASSPDSAPMDDGIDSDIPW